MEFSRQAITLMNCRRRYKYRLTVYPHLRIGSIRTLHSNGYIFPFLLCFLLFFFSQIFVRTPQTVILIFAFLFLGDSLDPCLLYNVTNLCPQFIRHSVYLIQSLKSTSHFHCIIIRDLIQVTSELSSGFPYLLQFKSEFGNKEFIV